MIGFQQILVRALCALAFVGALVVAGTARATTGVIHVGQKVLTEDHYGTFVLSGDGYLDCNGHTIYNSTQSAVCYDQDAGYFKCGVLVESSFDEWIVDIKNCNIEGFEQGITVAFSGANVWIYGNTIYDNEDGLYATYSYNFDVFDNDISSNADVGLRIYNSGMDFQSSDVFYNGSDGVDGDLAYGVLIQNNNIKENADHNLEFDDCQYVTVKSNSIDGYRSGGVNVETARDGLQLERVDHFTVQSNTVRDSGRHGIYLRDSLNGVVRSNNVANSGRKETGRDCYRRNGSATTFTSNTFGTQTGCSTVN